MDLHSQLALGMENLAKAVNERMNRFDTQLALQSGAKTTAITGTTDLTKLATDYADFKAMVLETLSMLQQQLQLLALGFDRHEAASRRKVLLFHGIPEDSGEQLESRVRGIMSENLKIPSVGSMVIDYCHRLGVKKEKPRPVLVRFADLKSRNAVWQAKTALKGSGLTVSEFLTKPRQGVFGAARKHFGLKNCWTADGTIVVALPNKSRAKIISMPELKALMDKYPPVTPTEASHEQKTSRTRRNAKTSAK